MNYPLEILPNKIYKLISCDLSEHFLIRHVNVLDSQQIVDPETNEVLVSFIAHPTEKTDDLSTSLLGVFVNEHIHIELTELGKPIYNCECSPNEDVNPPVYNKDFIINKNRSSWYISIGNIDNKEIKFRKEELVQIAKCTVVHTPMKWNYWHFAIRWKFNDDYIHIAKSSSWKRNLCSVARALISKNAFIKEPDYEELEKSNYSN